MLWQKLNCVCYQPNGSVQHFALARGKVFLTVEMLLLGGQFLKLKDAAIEVLLKQRLETLMAVNLSVHVPLCIIH